LVQSNDKIADLNATRAVETQFFGNGLTKRIISILNKTDIDITQQIQRLEDSPTRRRLRSILNEIRKINTATYNQALKSVNKELSDFADVEAMFQSEVYDDVFFGKVPITTPSSLYAVAVAEPFRGRLLSEWFSSLSEAKSRAISDAVTLGFTEGQTLLQITERIRGTKSRNYKDGILDISRRNAEAVIRTAITHISSEATQQVALANSDILKGLEWFSVLDGRTSAICRARDGKIYPLDTKDKTSCTF